ncbi:MAG: hypothetical protein M3546_04935 [Actinomycetota bacterium]|nr:hypothetical protein [Actinomycetota bacterium]
MFLVFDGAALDHLLFRIVERCPPSLDEFRFEPWFNVPNMTSGWYILLDQLSRNQLWGVRHAR